MSAMKVFGGAAAFALALTVWGGPACADDVAPPQSPAELTKALAEVGKPGPEHAKLGPLAGCWAYTGKFWLDPNKTPSEISGTIERHWILGGRFLQEKFAGTGLDGKPGWEGFGLIGYDNGRKNFTGTWACTMGTGMKLGSGVADATGQAFTFRTEAYCPLRKKVVEGREVIRIESNDKVVFECYETTDGKETKMMELISQRTKCPESVARQTNENPATPATRRE